VFSLLQTLPREKPSLDLQICIILRLLLALASRPGWLVLFLLVCDERELRPHQLVGGVRLDHLPNLVLLMERVQWTLHDWIEGPVVPLRIRPQLCHTFPPV
jgi:hypothetical protein